jgi:hypothetical protein
MLGRWLQFLFSIPQVNLAMIDTILLFALVLIFISFFLFAFIKRNKFSRLKILLFVVIGSVLIISLFLYTGTNKIKSDISRLIENSRQKKAEEVYALLFKKSVDNSLKIINFKDQVIPKIDCCIWMEVKLSPTELGRVIHLKKYKEAKLTKSDSLDFLASFGDRPKWWTPQILGDSVFKLNIKFDQDNEQTLFFSNDSSHIYLCDQAL